MKRSVLSGLGLAAIALSLAVVGCGGGGIEEGAPPDTKVSVPLDPKMVDMTGRSFAEQGKTKKSEGSEKEKVAAPAPAEEKK